METPGAAMVVAILAWPVVVVALSQFEKDAAWSLLHVPAPVIDCTACGAVAGSHHRHHVGVRQVGDGGLVGRPEAAAQRHAGDLDIVGRGVGCHLQEKRGGFERHG